MNPIIRNVLAIIAGIIAGSVVNMGLIMISGFIIPPPEGVDTSSMDGLKSGMHLFGPKHFVFPFLAHALGTLTGGLIAALIAAKQKMTIAMVVGVFFLVGGIINVFMLPSPLWFNTLDLIFAYIPMAWLGGMMVRNK
ncbi:MAG: hypothetical protein RQ761_05655 [Bacteroidales bacterium]|nr:hypothetical protein [Bacteroidales bacterium]